MTLSRLLRFSPLLLLLVALASERGGAQVPVPIEGRGPRGGPTQAAPCDIPGLRVEVTGPREFCSGDSLVLRAPTGYTYSWSTGATSQTITVRTSGNYFFRADSAACSGFSDTIHVLVHTRPQPRLFPSGVRTICQGDSLTLDVGVWRSVRWSTGDTSRRITVRNIGSYYADVTDTNNCSARSDTVTLLQNVKPEPLISPVGPLDICMGDSIALDAGAGYAAWRWNTGDTTQIIVAKKTRRYGVTVRSADGCWSDTVTVDLTVRQQTLLDWTINHPAEICEGDSFVVVLRGRFASFGWSTGENIPRVVTRQAGLLTGWGIDSSGCTTKVAFDVRLSPTPAPEIVADGALRFCSGDSVTLDAGDGYASYLWSDGSQSRFLVVRYSGQYNVMVWSQAGCVGGSKEVSVLVDEPPEADIKGPIAVCRGSVSVYSLTPNPNVSYIWSLSGSGSVASRIDSTSFVVQWGTIGTGRVRVVVIDTAGGCRTDTSISVVIQDTLQPRITSDPSPKLCPGGSVVLDAGDYLSYLWSTGDTTRTITLSSPASVTVRVVEAGGCAGTSDVFQVTPALLTAPAVYTPDGTTLCGSGRVRLYGASGYKSYRWSNGAVGRGIVVVDTGSYTLQVVDSNGCDGVSTSVQINREAPSTPTITGSQVVCHNGKVGYIVPSRSGYSYTWRVDGGTISGGQGRPEITVEWGTIDSGRVTVVERSPAGCVDSTSIAISIGDHLVPTVTVTGNPALCEGESLQLDAGPGYERYAWSTGETSRLIVVRSSGSYSVTVADSSGCVGTSQPVIVTTLAAPAVTVTPAGAITLCKGISVLLRGTPGLRDYRWSNGATGDTLLVRWSGSYSLSAANSDGCRGTSVPVTVTVLPAIPTPSVTRRNDTLISSNADRYQWLRDSSDIAGETSQRLLVSGLGTYRVRVFDANGCSATSDPFELNNGWRMHLDTINGEVGSPLQLTMRVTPPLASGDGITGYTMKLHADPRSLYMLRAEPGQVGGGVPQLVRDPDGTIHITLTGTQPLVGPVLFRIELYGLLTATPTTSVRVESALLVPGGGVATGDGVVLLKGCDIGRGIGFNRAVAITGVEMNPSGDLLSLRYHAPAGSEPTIVIVDGVGRQIMSWSLPEGTGGEQREVLATGHLSTGFYRLELRGRDERSVAPIIIVQ